MQLRHLPRTAQLQDVVNALEADGGVVIDDLVEANEIDSVMADLKPWIDATPFGVDESIGKATRRTGGFIARSVGARSLIMHPLILEAVGAVLHRASRFQLHLTQAISISPGEEDQGAHRDEWGFDFFQFPNDYDVMCNTIWAGTDFTAENGGTRIIPGSHRYEDNLKFEHDDTIAVEMRKGSVLIYNGKVYHGGGANRSQDVRCGLNITYSAGWLRQEENQYLSVPLDIARGLPTDLLRLIGYSRGAFGLGYVDDLRDPITSIRPQDGVIGFGDASLVSPG